MEKDRFDDLPTGLQTKELYTIIKVRKNQLLEQKHQLNSLEKHSLLKFGPQDTNKGLF